MRWLKPVGLALLAILVVAGAGYLVRHEIMRAWEGLPPFTHGAGEELEAMVPMADGVRLYTTVSLPDAPAPFPTVLIRNPYAEFGIILRDTLCGRFVRYGYACVLQDVRGQGKSEGEWNPGTNELNDGYDTLAWLVEQPFQDGNVGMVGPSYLASVQWAAAAAGLPPEVKTIVPAVYATDLRGVMYQDGMFRHETFTAWASMMRSANFDMMAAGEDYQRALKYRPHGKVDEAIFGTAMPWYQDMIDSASPSAPFWRLPPSVWLHEAPTRTRIPVLMIGGWYDVFFGPQFDDWQRLASRDRSRYVIGPWTHIGEGGEALETPGAEGGLFQWGEMLPWLETHLKGMPATQPTGVKAYRMHDNRWIEYATWPPATTTVRYTLGNLAGSNACTGGTLGDDAVGGGEGSVSFVYDPDNPAPTRGGAGMLAFILPGFDGAAPANAWQEGLCERDDVLSFVTGPLASALTISGAPRVALSVSSSAEDTAFTAKLVEVLPDGRAMNIRDSITSLAYRNGTQRALDYTPGERVEVDIRFWPIEWTLQPGSRLRLDISSSDFPKFHAHLNRRGNWPDIEAPVVATQTLYAGSWLELDLAPE